MLIQLNTNEHNSMQHLVEPTQGSQLLPRLHVCDDKSARRSAFPRPNVDRQKVAKNTLGKRVR